MMASIVVVTMIDTYYTSHTVMFSTRLNFDVQHVTIRMPLIFEMSGFFYTNRDPQYLLDISRTESSRQTHKILFRQFQPEINVVEFLMVTELMKSFSESKLSDCQQSQLKLMIDNADTIMITFKDTYMLLDSS